MRKGTLIIFTVLLLLVSCERRKNPGYDNKILLKTDQDFSQMSMEKGMKAAFLFYAAEDVIKMREGKVPLFGINELAKSMEGISDKMISLQWIPLKADISGNLGYTFGKWEMRVKGQDSIQYGTYVTIWKQQDNGSWKFILDAGNSTPKP